GGDPVAAAGLLAGMDRGGGGKGGRGRAGAGAARGGGGVVGGPVRPGRAPAGRPRGPPPRPGAPGGPRGRAGVAGVRAVVGARGRAGHAGVGRRMDGEQADRASGGAGVPRLGGRVRGPGAVDLAWLLVSSVDPARWDQVIAAYGPAGGLRDALPAVMVQGLL